MTKCPACATDFASGSDCCPNCLTAPEGEAILPGADVAALNATGSPFYANTFEDAVEMKAALQQAGIKVLASMQDLTHLGISLHDTEGYRLLVPSDAASDAFDVLRREAPRALFSELESGLGWDISEILSWPLNPDFRACLLPGMTTEEFLDRVLGPEESRSLLQQREQRALAPEAVAPILERAFAAAEVDHEELFDELAPASASAFDLIFDALMRATREQREDIVWTLARCLKRFRAEWLGHHLSDFGPSVRAPQEGVRRLTALAIGLLLDRRAAHYLVELLADPDEQVRYEAIDALYAMAGKDLGYVSDASEAERTLAIQRWQGWLREVTE